ncbi:MAG: PBECR2 nuclease fold domain-containing protein, partial [Aquabacterium sp.]
PAAMLLPPDVDKQEAVRRFLAEFGAAPGRPVAHTDPLGETLIVSDELFKDLAGRWKVKRGRERWMLLLAQALREPDEIWYQRVPHLVKGREVGRRRYLARFRVEGEDTPALAVFETGPDGWLGVTAYQAEAQKNAAELIDASRRGELLWRRGQG